MPILLDMFHLRNWKPSRPRAPVKTALRECTLNAVKTARRRNQGSQKDHQFEHPVRKPRVGMQYLIHLPFRLYGFPGPPPIKHESKLVRVDLGIFGDGTAYLRVDAELLKLVRKAACEHRK